MRTAKMHHVVSTRFFRPARPGFMAQVIQDPLHPFCFWVATPYLSRRSGQQDLKLRQGNLEKAVDLNGLFGKLVNIIGVQGAASNHFALEQDDVFTFLQLLHILYTDFLDSSGSDCPILPEWIPSCPPDAPCHTFVAGTRDRTSIAGFRGCLWGL